MNINAKPSPAVLSRVKKTAVKIARTQIKKGKYGDLE